MGKTYGSIKDLVLDYVKRKGGHASYEALTIEVSKHFPSSKWKPTHWDWYRTQIIEGKFAGIIPEEARDVLAASTQRIEPVSAEARRIADGIAEDMLSRLRSETGGDPKIMNQVRRRIHDRLMEDVDTQH